MAAVAHAGPHRGVKDDEVVAHYLLALSMIIPRCYFRQECTETASVRGAVVTEQPAISFNAVRVEVPSASGVAIDGEVDVAAVPGLERALEAAIETTAGGFVVDLSGVEFMDSSGLLAMLNARGLLAREERALAVVCPVGPVRQLIEVAGVADLLVVCDSREDAEAALS